MAAPTAQTPETSQAQTPERPEHPQTLTMVAPQGATCVDGVCSLPR
jgi:hypothetical protein